MGHAAFGGMAITSFLSGMAANSAMPSICMYRLYNPQSSLISSRTEPTRRTKASLLGKIQTTSVRRLTSLCNFSQWVGAVRFGPAPCGKIHVGERVVLAGVHESAEPGVKGAIAIAPGLRRGRLIGKSGARRQVHDDRRRSGCPHRLPSATGARIRRWFAENRLRRSFPARRSTS